MFQNSCHMFNFNCGFTNVSHIWSDRKFTDESNGSCCKVIGATTIELSTISIKVCKGFVCFLTEKFIFTARFGLTI